MQEKVDVLNRDEFVNRVYNLIKVITEIKRKERTGYGLFRQRKSISH